MTSTFSALSPKKKNQIHFHRKDAKIAKKTKTFPFALRLVMMDKK